VIKLIQLENITFDKHNQIKLSQRNPTQLPQFN